jgi:hypothetical protein
MATTVFARTNADFLNQFFGTNYRQFMRSRWPYDENTWVWMVRMDGKSRDGWINREVSPYEVWEEYAGIGAPSYNNVKEMPFRIIVRIVEGSQGREYRVLGKYRYDFHNSDYRKHIFKKFEEM